MSLLDSEQLIRDHLNGNPEAQHAVLHDAEYAAEVHRLRTVLGNLDTVLVDEGLPADIRQRVLARLVADCLGTDEANARMRSRAQLVMDMFNKGVVPMPTPLDLSSHPA